MKINMLTMQCVPIHAKWIQDFYTRGNTFRGLIVTIQNSGGFRHRYLRTALFGALGALVPLAAVGVANAQVGWTHQDPAKTVAPAPQPTYPAAVANPATTMGAAATDVPEIDRIARALVAGQRIPGLAIAIVQHGRVVYEQGYGITDMQRPEPVDIHTVFRLASLSKSFASALTGILVNDGRLHWNDSVVHYVPSFRMPSPAATNEVTVEDVLGQRTGLVHNAYDRDIEGGLDYPSAVQKLATAPMKCQPGECYGYQNVAFSLIGDVVFAATGHFYPQAVENRLFKPLGMNDASYGLGGIESSPRWAKPHVRGGGSWRAIRPKPSYYLLAPAAGVNASISDMAQWMIAQTGHRPDVLPANVLQYLHTSGVETPTELRGSSWRRERLNDAGYGLAWRIYNYAGHPFYFHGGAVQGYRGAMGILPERDLGVVILWNSESSLPSGLMPTIIDRALGLPAEAWIPNTITGESAPTRIAGMQDSDSGNSGND